MSSFFQTGKKTIDDSVKFFELPIEAACERYIRRKMANRFYHKKSNAQQFRNPDISCSKFLA